jgi:hypothetical protein
MESSGGPMSWKKGDIDYASLTENGDLAEINWG